MRTLPANDGCDVQREHRHDINDGFLNSYIRINRFINYKAHKSHHEYLRESIRLIIWTRYPFIINLI